MANANQNSFNGGFSKILKEEWQVDVLLKAGDSKEAAPISAHKLVLAARSEVFKKMFESDEIKSCNMLETVTLSNMDKEELEAFVDFIYRNGSHLCGKHKKHVESLYIAADKYEIPYLRELCREELIWSMETFNALHILEISSRLWVGNQSLP